MMDIQKLKQKEAWIIGDWLRTASKELGFYHVQWDKFLFWHFKSYRIMFFDQIVITPENIQYQVMRFRYTPKLFTQIRFLPSDYRAWLDDNPREADYGSFPCKISELYTDEVLTHMSIKLERNVTSPNQLGECRQGVWYVVDHH